MAALTLADELAETKERMTRMEPELTKLQEGGVAAAERAKATETAIIAALHAAAERIESITKRSNETVTPGDLPIG